MRDMSLDDVFTLGNEPCSLHFGQSTSLHCDYAANTKYDMANHGV